jgi:AraC family transcriptional regulator
MQVHQRPEQRVERGATKHLEHYYFPVGLVAVESERSLPTSRVVFECAKILNVIEGAVDAETADGSVTLAPGMSLALGKAHWCKLRPRPMVLVWTIYVDEDFLRAQMAWFLPDVRRIRAVLHPHQWDGGALVHNAGARTLNPSAPYLTSLLCCAAGDRWPSR